MQRVSKTIAPWIVAGQMPKTMNVRKVRNAVRGSLEKKRGCMDPRKKNAAAV